MDVRRIISKKNNKEYLSQFINHDYVSTVCFKENPECLIKSDALLGSLAEQLILVKMYKRKSSNHFLKSSIEDYIFRMEEIINEVNYKAGLADSFSVNQNTNGITVFYNDLNLHQAAPYFPNSNHASSKFVNTYAFADDTKAIRFQFSDGLLGPLYLIDYSILLKLIKKCSKRLKDDVYSKKKVSDESIVKLLLFSNILNGWPIYICGTIWEQYATTKLFLNYDELVSNVCHLVNSNIEILNSLGEFHSYQASISYKEIHGRVDFITNDSLIEIKTGGQVTRQDLYQALIYALISRVSRAAVLKKIKTIKLLYLNLGKIVVLDTDKIMQTLTDKPKTILEALMI